METCDPALDNRFNTAFGFPAERIRAKVVDTLSEPIKAFIAESPFAVMATSSPDGKCDASPKGGPPGFVQVLDDRHLLVPDIAGNLLFQSYLNMDVNPQVGLIFFIPGLAEVVRVNGRVQIVDRNEVERYDVDDHLDHPAGRRDLLQGIVVEVEEAYGHCPRAINYSDLWNPDGIRERVAGGSAAHPLRRQSATTTQD